MLKITVNYDNMIHNFKSTTKYINSLGSNAKIIPMIKSNAYRTGEEGVVATLIKKVNVDTFFNFSLLDAVRIRKLANKYFSNKKITVYPVVGMLEGEENDYYNNQITPVINNLEQYNRWNNFAKSKNQRLNCVLQFNTGMNRSGFEYFDAENIKELFDNKNNYLDIDYVMSHLCCADDLQSPMNKRQLNNLLKVKEYFKDNKFCFTASEGTYLGKDYLFDAIRPFQCLVYTINYKNDLIGIKQVLEINSNIVKLDNNIATVDIGYGNGYKIELLENKNLSVLINDKQYRVLNIGEVETQIQVDNEVKIGDEVIITNYKHPLQAITENTTIDSIELQLAVLSNKNNQNNIFYKTDKMISTDELLSQQERERIDSKRFKQIGENAFETVITETRVIESDNEYVGYSSRYKAKIGDKICVIPVGYFDIDKQFVKHNQLTFTSVNGIKFARVGNPSMNQITISCDHSDNDKVKIGDKIKIEITE